MIIYRIKLINKGLNEAIFAMENKLQAFRIYKGTNIKGELKKVVKQLKTRIDTYEQCGSG